MGQVFCDVGDSDGRSSKVVTPSGMTSHDAFDATKNVLADFNFRITIYTTQCDAVNDVVENTAQGGPASGAELKTEALLANIRG